MISRRLTKIQKDEIVEAYRNGENTNILAKKYSCSSNTINRTVKTLLSDYEYKVLKEKRLNISNKKFKQVKNDKDDFNEDDFEKLNSSDSSHVKVNEEEPLIKADNDSNNSEFEEIAPLLANFDFEKKELDFEILNQEVLPESVYMLVDKKVELEVTAISGLPEWSFLPENELKRNAIVLFSNQRNAKRSCSRNQRVIKIPNTSVFEVSKSYLLSKGITRLILEDSIIALEN
tara:strand:+ start:316 stop:1011 length:696 start_codon:yes stop_codon:yes gene_type:complete